LSVIFPSIRSLRQDSSADIPVAEAIVENANTAEEQSNVSPVCLNALKTSNEERDNMH